MKSLNNFLNPKRKPNLKFKLEAFDEEFEMRQLTADEDLRVSRQVREKGESSEEIMVRYVAESMVVPDLHNKELLDALSEREGRKILDPVQALKGIVNGPELSVLVSVYMDYANATVSFSKKVEEVKN